MRTNIALPPFHNVEITRFTVESDYELTQTLRRYQVFYKDAYGATVTEAELFREMARCFMANDGDFQASGQKRRRARKTATQASAKAAAAAHQLNFEATGA